MGAPIWAGEASPLRGGDRWRRELGLEARRHRSLACPNKRRENSFVHSPSRRPKRGSEKHQENRGEILTHIGHPFKSDPERRFAPTTVRSIPDCCPLRIGTGVRFHRNPHKT